MPRASGQGYCLVEDLEVELPAETANSTNVQRLAPRWIARWSDYVDDRIRVVYAVPFPPAPNGSGTLALIVTLLVVHQVYVYNGMYRGDEKASEQSYWGRAQKMLDDIVAGTLKLEAVYAGQGPNGADLNVGNPNLPIYVSRGTNPLSIHEQEHEFGPAVRSGRNRRADSTASLDADL